jgi:hypothetical protein
MNLDFLLDIYNASPSESTNTPTGRVTVILEPEVSFIVSIVNLASSA